MEPDTATPTRRETSPWRYVGCACGSFVLVVMLAVVALAFLAYQKGKRFERDLADPAARTERSREILGFDELPDGYYPMGGFAIPWVMEMTMLGDRDLAPGETIEDESEAFRERGFVFMNIRPFGDQPEELREFFLGERSETEFFADSQISFASAEVLGRGSLLSGPAQVLWIAERGTIALAEGRRPAVLARLLVDCPRDERLRVGLWFTPPAELPRGSDGADAPVGPPADPDEITRFLDHFDLCR